jgi:hydrogenase maturation protease
MIRIIGIGSPFGDDAAGLEAARQLAADPPAGSEVIEADRPGATLIDLFDGADAVILIDAARSGALAGTLHDIDLYALSAQPLGLLSSHGIGVAEAVHLAATLGRLPARGRVLAIEVVTSCGAHPAGLSVTAYQGATKAVQRARVWCSADA